MGGLGQGNACWMDPPPQKWKLRVAVSTFMALGPEMVHDEGLSYSGQSVPVVLTPLGTKEFKG